jgi:hypothetical protein
MSEAIKEWFVVSLISVAPVNGEVQPIGSNKGPEDEF